MYWYTLFDCKLVPRVANGSRNTKVVTRMELTNPRCEGVETAFSRHVVMFSTHSEDEQPGEGSGTAERRVATKTSTTLTRFEFPGVV